MVAVGCSSYKVVQIVVVKVNITSKTSIIARIVASLVSYKIGFCKSICGAIIDYRVRGYIS